MTRKFLFSLALPICVALGGLPGQAGSLLSNLHGVTSLADGTPLAQARITLHGSDDSSDRTTVSNADGSFEFTGVQPGHYLLNASKDDLQSSSLGLQLAAEDNPKINVALSSITKDVDPAVAKLLSTMQKRMEDLEAELKDVKAKLAAQPDASKPAPGETAQNSTKLPLVASLGAPPVGSLASPPAPGTLAHGPLTAKAEPANGSAAAAQETAPSGSAGQSTAPALPAVDNQTPFAFGDFTWLNGTPRNKDVVLDTPFFTPEVRFDTHYMEDFNQPRDHTIVGATESFRSGEVQIEQASVGGDFHWQNVRGRILLMYGLFATTTPRNDASFGTGNWNLRGAYQYVSEAYGGYHFNVQHGLNVDAGIFVSYIGLFSYYNFDNWTYQPSYVSSNTPWFFNGVRVQWFPTNKLKIEPWFINGWQSYAKYNGHPGLGGQLLWQPTEWFKLVANQYGYGQDNLGLPHTERIHTDDSIEIRFYNNPNKDRGISKIAMSLTADAGAQYGGGLCGTCAPSKGKESFVGWMLYNRYWWNKDKYAITFGGGEMSNYGRYLTLLPPIDGADAVTGSVYFPAPPGSKAHMWDSTVTFHYMPKQYITWWAEVGYRHSDIPYFAGRGGVTPPGFPLGGTNGFPQYYTCTSGSTAGTADPTAAAAACGGAGNVWYPDLRRSETKASVGIMVKF